MKKVQKLPVVLSMVLVILSILFVGCFRSISPIYTDKDIIFDPALFGIYQDPNYSNNYTLIEQDSDPRFYRITLKEDNYEFLLRGTLVKFGGVEFLDVEPLERLAHQIPGVVGGVDVAKDFVWQPVHTFFKIVAKTPDLKLAMMDEKGLLHLQKKDPNALKFQGTLLVSSTEELQSFLKRYGNDTNVFNRQSGLGTRVHQMKKENTPSKPLRFVNQGHVEPSHDGQPGELDIYEMKLAWPGQGHLIINRWLTARKTPKKLFDSKIRLSVPNGGIQPATGDFATVPETGYLKFVEFSSPTNHWAIRVETNYFVKLGNGNYSRIFITFQTDQPSIDIRSYNDITGSKDFKWTVEQPAKQVFE